MLGAALLAGAWTERSHAFWSASLYQIHQAITMQVLSGDFTFGGQSGYTFSDAAIAAINQQHKYLDTSSNYDPLDHFDGEQLVDGFQRLKETRALLEYELKQPSPDTFILWTLVGELLHQMQDFYSHSTYASSQIGAPQDFATLTDSTTTPTIPDYFTDSSYPDTNAQDCESDFITLLPVVTSSALITTGYYQAVNPNAGKCNHGLYGTNALGVPKTVVVGALCQIGVKAPADGIARDHPCSSEDSEVLDYEAAHDLAVQETTMFMTAIIKYLDGNNYSAGFCALLGLDNSAQACQPKIPQNGMCTSSNSCVLWNVGSVAFQADPCSMATIYSRCSLDELEAVASNDANGPLDYIEFSFLYTMTGPSIENFTNNLTAGVTATSPPMTFQLTANDPFSTDATLSSALVGFVTKEVITSPPTFYPVNALQSSAAYLQNNPQTAQGSLTFTITSQPTSDATTCTSICTGANLIFSGSFDFYIDDPQILYTENFAIGSHHITGTFTFPEGTCQVFAGQTGLACPTGSH
jgi:hypothetical protein